MLRTPRGLARLFLLVLSTLQAMASLWLLQLRHRGRITNLQRAQCMQRACHTILRRLSVKLEVRGDPPRSGLIVSNHLSYLDILLYGAATPCIFVSKIEVRKWPLFGAAGALAGTIFVDRSRPAAGSSATARVEDVLRQGVSVLLFPEGTSTDGSEVLPFRSSFFEPAVRTHSPVTAAAITYPEGREYIETDICYYGDISFAPHLIQTLGLHGLAGRIDFSPNRVRYEDRKLGAHTAHGEVLAMRRQREQGLTANPLDPLPHPITQEQSVAAK